ncbi:Hypothetical predicted protein [Mytilus galloprovincialis]|uniref:RING-type domain-containing protein n=2 Tax=Mytilus galloprovincialis TaxID=29158 RepID=A0A8B6H2V6_MYTGA|nr:Hypothetical predicted protein [Mytilus galloprovincialis]
MMWQVKVQREQVEAVVGVILRIPSLVLAELWFRTSPEKLTDQPDDVTFIITVIYYLSLFFALALAALPLKNLVYLYIYTLSAGLVCFNWYMSHLFVNTELSQESESLMFLTDSSETQRVLLHLLTQCITAAFICYLLEITNWTRFVFLAFVLPVLAKIMGMPSDVISGVHNFSTIFTILLVAFTVFNNLSYTFETVRVLLRKLSEAVTEFGWIPVILASWNTLHVGIQLLIFWLYMFISHIYVFIKVGNSVIIQEGFSMIILAVVGECCATPISLLALSVTVSYFSYFILTFTKIFLQGWRGYMNDNDTFRGWTEGGTMLLIAFQTGLTDLKPIQRTFLMSILLFIVVSSLIESMYEVADPILLSLSAAHNRNIFKHFRAVLLFTFLWMFPLYMTYSICQYFTLDFWLLVIISSGILTTFQALGSLTVYSLFIYDSLRENSWEKLDDVIYYTRATVRVFEFLVALFVVCFGLKETLVGHWSLINSAILIVHCYFNVYKRLETGWKTFLLRREAVSRVESLPQATEEQLNSLSDVCPICFSTMTQAKVTSCNHFFHATCLRKWLYVKDTCPMCHKKIEVKKNDENQTGIVVENNYVHNLMERDDELSEESDMSESDTESDASTEILEEDNDQIFDNVEAERAALQTIENNAA